MKIYSQNDKRWSGERLGYCSKTIGEQGCLVTDFSNIYEKLTPKEMNNLFKKKNIYTQGCLVKWADACKLLRLEWHGFSSRPKFYPTMARVKTKSGIEHFVILLYRGKDLIIDPWDGRRKRNPYSTIGVDKKKLFCNVKKPVKKTMSKPKTRAEIVVENRKLRLYNRKLRLWVQNLKKKIKRLRIK
jgi:hypothetical protein